MQPFHATPRDLPNGGRIYSVPAVDDDGNKCVVDIAFTSGVPAYVWTEIAANEARIERQELMAEILRLRMLVPHKPRGHGIK